MPDRPAHELVGTPLQPFAPIRIGEWLQLSAALRPAERCFVDEGFGRTLTFADVNARVNRLANALLFVNLVRFLSELGKPGPYAIARSRPSSAGGS